MADNYKKINEITESIKLMQQQYHSMRQEMSEAQKEIDALNKELEISPSFGKTKELSVLEDGYLKYKKMCEALHEKITAEKANKSEELSRLTREIILSQVKHNFDEKQNEVTNKIYESAKLILAAAVEVYDYKETAIAQAVEEIESKTGISQYLYEGESTNAVGAECARELEAKVLTMPARDMLENIEKNYI